MLMRRFAPFFLLMLLSSGLVFAGDPPVDNSKADTDGPHVFYRGKNIVVKMIEREDTANVVRVNNYKKQDDIQLHCNVSQTGDAFHFTLKKKLKVEKDHYPLPARMLVVSDIEGNFEAFKILLQSAKVIDSDFNWIYGDGHLVLVGDFFDRGLNVTEVLWLIYKLESEADEAGGKIHFILGNHEVMNLCGEHGYVRNKYQENALLIGEDYAQWYDDHSELGRWLRTKNAVEKIGDYVFCHGGISPYLAASTLSLSDINDIARKYLGTNYSEITDSIAQFVYHTREGIFWFRGASKNKLTRSEVDAILSFAGAKRMVVGHTLVPDVMGLYEGRVICVDLFHDENLRKGVLKTLYIEDGFLYTVDSLGGKSSIFTVAFKDGSGG